MKDQSYLNDLVIEMHTIMKVIQERIDRHSGEQQAGFKNLNNRLEELKSTQMKDKEILKEDIHQLELITKENHHKTNTKVATLSAIISIIVTFFTGFISQKIFGNK